MVQHVIVGCLLFHVVSTVNAKRNQREAQLSKQETSRKKSPRGTQMVATQAAKLLTDISP